MDFVSAVCRVYHRLRVDGLWVRRHERGWTGT
jgi:hypothetical protein